jgi:hypothetical protein
MVKNTCQYLRDTLGIEIVEVPVVLPITGKESFLAPLTAALEGMDDPRCVLAGMIMYVFAIPLYIVYDVCSNVTFDRDGGGAGGAPHHVRGELPRPAQGRSRGWTTRGTCMA